MFTTLITKIKQIMQGLGQGYNNSSQKIDDLLNNFNQDEKSKRRWTITLSALGVVLFLLLAAVLPFKDTLFNLLYPKPASRAGVCTGGSLVPATQAGFVYNGGDLSQEIEALGTSLYYTRDLSLGPQKKIFLIGKYVGNGGGPLGLDTLMGDNLSNFEFQGAGGQPPVGWKFLTAGRSGEVAVETARQNVFSGQTSVKITNHKSPFGTQLAQSFKSKAQEGDLVIFGSWVKTLNPAGVKILLQNDASPFEDIGQISTAAVAGQWNFVLGYAKIPPKVTSFQLVLRVTSQESEAWFDAPVVAVIDAKANTQITKLVSERCGSAWFVGNEPGKESSSGSVVMAPVTAEVYALIYRQFYQAIKEIDPSALVLPGGLAGPPSSFDGQGGYSPKSFLDGWRRAYKNFFATEPPLDAMNLHYLATNNNRWPDASDLENYLQKVHSYMTKVPGWGGKPIWLSELGVASSAPNTGVDFAKSAVQFLAGNRLDVAKWFWFDTCGYNPGLAPLFESNNRICTWPVKPTLLGEIYRSLMPTPTPAPSSSPTASAPARSQVLVQPLGLSAVNPFEDVQRTGQPFNESTYQNPSISGVTFRTSWQDLEPENGKYNFRIMDEVFAQAASHDKWVDLILIPGFGTPSWALEGVQTAQFNVKYGQGQGENLTLPLPWDKTYLNRWFTFLEEVNKRYGYRPEFRMISAAGPTSVSSEMSLPNTSEDLLTWQRVGYTPEKYLNAWKKTFAAYARIFPNQYFSLALYPGLPLPDSSYRDGIRSDVISLGVTNYPKQFALQTSGLNPTKDDTEGAGYLIVKSYSSQILTGFMMSASFTNKQAKYGDPAIALQTSIDRGLAAQAKYLEIYEDDILNPALQNILNDTAKRMSGSTTTPIPSPSGADKGSGATESAKQQK